MGASFSTLSKGTSAHIVVEPQRFVPRGGFSTLDHILPVTQEASRKNGGVDSTTWNQLVRELDPLARRLNYGMSVPYAIRALVFALFIMYFFVSGGNGVFFIGFVLMLVVNALVLGYMVYVLGTRNPQVDAEIRQVLDRNKPRFGGYRLEYLTEYTGVFKCNKYARSCRVVGFFPDGSAAAAAALPAPSVAVPASGDEEQSDPPMTHE